MSLHIVTRVAAAVAVSASVVGFAASDLNGDYNVEFAIEDQTYTGTAKATAGAKGAFSGAFTFTSPSNVIADVTGKTFGDSVTYTAKYADKDRGCTGTFAGKGTVEKGGAKAAGTVEISDSCSGAISGKFRLFR
jgi:hypothetical protein